MTSLVKLPVLSRCFIATVSNFATRNFFHFNVNSQRMDLDISISVLDMKKGYSKSHQYSFYKSYTHANIKSPHGQNDSKTIFMCVCTVRLHLQCMQWGLSLVLWLSVHASASS